MVAMETATVIKFKFKFLVYIFKLFKGAKFDNDQIMEKSIENYQFVCF